MIDDESDLEERLAPCPEEDPCTLQRLEVHFDMPVLLTKDQHNRLRSLLDEIVKSPYNQPKNGIHWLSGAGAGLSDESLYWMRSTARGFASEREKARVLKERATLQIVGTCSLCHEFQFMAPNGSGPVCKNGHGGAPSL